MTHETQDTTFQEGRAVAAYLEAHPCDRPECGGKKTCPMCINYAVQLIGYDMETERRKAAVHDFNIKKRKSKRVKQPPPCDDPEYCKAIGHCEKNGNCSDVAAVREAEAERRDAAEKREAFAIWLVSH